jgi:hypothetical protein
VDQGDKQAEREGEEKESLNLPQGDGGQKRGKSQAQVAPPVTKLDGV